MTEKLLTGTLSLNTTNQSSSLSNEKKIGLYMYLTVWCECCFADCHYGPNKYIDNDNVTKELWLWRVKRICVVEHSVMTNFNCACPAIQKARDQVFCLKVPLDSLLVWASSEGSGETARMRRLAWTFAARIGDKYQNRLTRPMWCHKIS